MIEETYAFEPLSTYEVIRLREILKKQAAQIKRFKNGREYINAVSKLEKRNAELREELAKVRQRIDWYGDKLRVQYDLYDSLSQKYVKLDRKFEANFKFHEYIRDVLDQTADLMENYDVVREQGETIQEGIQAASRTRRTRKPDGASAGAS